MSLALVLHGDITKVFKLLCLQVEVLPNERNRKVGSAYHKDGEIIASALDPTGRPNNWRQITIKHHELYVSKQTPCLQDPACYVAPP